MGQQRNGLAAARHRRFLACRAYARRAKLPPLPPGWPGGPGTAWTAAPPDLLTGPQPVSGADGVMRHLPYFCRGQVVRGFGRGSKQLGIPTGEPRSPGPLDPGSRGRGMSAVGAGSWGAGRCSRPVVAEDLWSG